MFSGEGVSGLRDHLNREPSYAIYRDRATVTTVSMNRRPPPTMGLEIMDDAAQQQQPMFGAPEPYIADDDDDGMEEGNEMAMDPQLPANGEEFTNGGHVLPPPIPIPGPAAIAGSTLIPTAPPFTPAAFLHSALFPANTPAVGGDAHTHPLQHHAQDMLHSASVAPVGMSFYEGELQQGPSTATGLTGNHQMAGNDAAEAGASRASLNGGGFAGNGISENGGPSTAAATLTFGANLANDAPSSRSSSPGDA